ncbi:unnamed protein product [Mytilus edulis]|uniref:Uncharacterized protein n=1 Tax=Mytilus edulis TaxID=6550 RepID=A0A8S3QK79_MYTED|nr:unnamed protein product [Mytilus edulis]
MASQRFGNSTEDDLQRLLCDKDAKNTKKATKAALTCLMQFMLSTERDNLVLETPEQLNECLIKFYADARKKDGSFYKLSALKGLRFGLARHFLKEMDVDIIKDVRFKRANDIFKAVSVQLKREGLGSIDHTPSLDQQDLKKLYGSVAMKVDTPAGLLHKVWFDIMFHLCRRGRENLREMNKSTFAIQTDASGREYVFQARDELDKNHRENSDSCITEGRMYAVPGKE